jgi:PncC family amidohydrolase
LLRDTPRELARSIGEALVEKNKTLAVAESCTGGGLARQIVAISGSSRYFLGGVVAYANGVKHDVLGVGQETLERFGAVSWQTASEMARGARNLVGTDFALSTTGIAGPTGGTSDKPVGTVYVALASSQETIWEHHRWEGTREGNIDASIYAALALLDRHLREPKPAREAIAAPKQQKPSRAISTSAEDLWVQVATGSEGAPTPVEFGWRGERFVVSSWGRSWTDDEEAWHVLVQCQARGSFELVRRPTGRWAMGRAWPKPTLS